MVDRSRAAHGVCQSKKQPRRENVNSPYGLLPVTGLGHRDELGLVDSRGKEHGARDTGSDPRVVEYDQMHASGEVVGRAFRHRHHNVVDLASGVVPVEWRAEAYAKGIGIFVRQALDRYRVTSSEKFCDGVIPYRGCNR